MRHQLALHQYGVGIICALSLELTAVLTMLDEEHDRPPGLPRDEEPLRFGAMQGHNVVVSCLLAGLKGKSEATSLATRLKMLFHSMEFVVFIGVAGGAPGMVPEMRLGDIVVSTPSEGHPGVVELDFGKLTEKGPVQAASHDKPHRRLLGAITNLQAEHRRHGSRITEYIGQAAATEDPVMRARFFTWPGADQDRLFRVDFEHVGTASTCTNCHDSGLVPDREPRQDSTPRIFYGNIGCSDRVVKNARQRDEIASRNNVICFEMEGAGVARILPYLVVRGICDYADSHKNKRWQHWAATTAAACAKELLHMVSPTMEPLGSDTHSGWRSHDTSTRGHAFTTLASHKTNPEIGSVSIYGKMLHVDPALQAPDYNEIYNISPISCRRSLTYEGMQARMDDIDEPMSHTCRWLVENQTYQTWMASGGLLYLFGKPGSGKSTIMKHTIRDLEKRNDASKPGLVLSHFFDARGSSFTNDFSAFLRDLLYQMLLVNPAAEQAFMGMCQKLCVQRDCAISKMEWHDNNLRECLKDLVALTLKRQKMIIYVDALDECELASSFEVQTFIRDLIAVSADQNKTTYFAICVASRPWPRVMGPTECSIQLDVCNEGDIATTTDLLLHELALSETEREVLADRLKERANGVIQWVVLVIAEIRNEVDNLQDIDKILEQVKKAPLDLNKIYENLLGQIATVDIADTIALMRWICFAAESLPFRDLQFAMAISHPALQPPSLEHLRRKSGAPEDRFEGRIRALSRGLVEMKGDAKIVQFVHYTVQEYMVERGFALLHKRLGGAWTGTTTSVVQAAEDQLAQACIVLIGSANSFEMEQQRPLNTDEALSLPLLDYARHNWDRHFCRSFNHSLENWDALDVLMLVHDQVFSSGAGRLSHVKEEESAISLPHLQQHGVLTSNVLELVSAHGLLDAAITTMGRHDVALKTFGRCDAARFTYDVAADNAGYLVAAASGGNLDLFKLLLNFRQELKGVTNEEERRQGMKRDCQLARLYGIDALYCAVARNNVEVVRHIIELIAPPSPSDIFRNAALKEPLSLPNASLISSSDQVDHDEILTQDMMLQALSIAIEADLVEVVELLLSHGINVNTTKSSLLPLEKAVVYDRIQVARLLLVYGADVNAIGGFGDAALHDAIANKSLTMVALLLHHPTRPCPRHLKHKDGGHQAVVSANAYPAATDHEEHIWSANPDIADSAQKTALMKATRKNAVDIIEILLSHGANVDARDKDGWTALMYAALGDATSALEVLLKYGACVNARDINGDSALIVASRHGSSEEIKILIEHGADIDLRNKDEGTALMAAARENAVEGVRVLLLSGANSNATDEDNWSALHHAAQCNAKEVAELLIEHDALVNSVTISGRTPLMLTAKDDAVDVAQTLLLHGADSAVTEEDGWPALAYAAFYGASRLLDVLLQPKLLDKTLLLSPLPAEPYVGQSHESKDAAQVLDRLPSTRSHASSLGYSEDPGTLHLHDKSADSNIGLFDHMGVTALHIALEEGNISAAKLLLDRGVFVESGCVSQTLSFAAARGGAASIRCLLAARSDTIVQPSPDYSSSLYHAACDDNDDIDALEVLLAYGHSVLLACRSWLNPVQAAAIRGNREIVSLLLKYIPYQQYNDFYSYQIQHICLLAGLGVKMASVFEADVDIPPDILGRSPIAVAACSQHEESLAWVLEGGIQFEIDQQDNSGFTALHWAAYLSLTRNAELLVAAGADQTVTDHLGRTASDLAQGSANEGTIQVFSGTSDRRTDREDGPGRGADGDAAANNPFSSDQVNVGNDHGPTAQVGQQDCDCNCDCCNVDLYGHFYYCEQCPDPFFILCDRCITDVRSAHQPHTFAVHHGEHGWLFSNSRWAETRKLRESGRSSQVDWCSVMAKRKTPSLMTGLRSMGTGLGRGG